ncbi:hypothetical protein GXW83_16205 [Streptacidiphilus sp. PB12-B1b]|uniref:hypothetical protein n=1 Tax=Streptacidiphilus sp. PB12-B1b TaxID=2705012 RepID=UPI0015FBCFCA|nr:hypothetical protein [Streptacidiphilus sp. PB12-B1b]QMU77017.1 hypothetical protein GXW83_16205 [Streptacidiphilus sp. PB12-B1b]
MSAPAVRNEIVPAAPAGAVLVPGILTAPQHVIDDLTRDITSAAGAVASMPPDADSDITISTRTSVTFAASSQGGALQAAADWSRTAAAEDAQIHSTGWARIPAMDDDDGRPTYEHRFTLVVSWPDEATGEYVGDVHTPDRAERGWQHHPGA